jgi:hypothetical protein
MIDKTESILDYNLTDLEIEVLKLSYIDETSYLRLTPPLKILSDFINTR